MNFLAVTAELTLQLDGL